MSRIRTRVVLILLLATLAWSVGTASTTLHFHGVVHAVDAATGQVVHLGCCGHHHGDDGVHEHVGPPHSAPGWTSAMQGSHGPEACLHLSSLIHAASVLAALPARPGLPDLPLPSVARVGSAAANTIELLSLAPKLPPPPAHRP